MQDADSTSLRVYYSSKGRQKGKSRQVKRCNPNQSGRYRTAGRIRVRTGRNVRTGKMKKNKN